MEGAAFTLKVRMQMAKVMETWRPCCTGVLRGPLVRSTSLSSQRHTANFSQRSVIGRRRRQRTAHLMSHAKALKEARSESVETTIRKRRPLIAGGIRRATNEWLTRRVMFGTMAGGENPGSGRPEHSWAQCLADDLRVFQAPEGSTESSHLLLGVGTVLWPKGG